MVGITLDVVARRKALTAVGVVAALLIAAAGVSRLGPIGGVVAGSSAAAAGGVFPSAASQVSAPFTGHTAAVSGRMMVEQATLALSVSRMGPAETRIAALAAHYGGYIQSSSFSGGTMASGGETLRVPAHHLQALLTALKGLGRVQQASLSGQDVTRQYNTLTFQLNTLKAEDIAYQRLFAKATSMQSMLQIQQALSQVQSQMTQLGTQQLSLAHQVTMATVNVSLTTTVPPTGFQAANIFLGSLRAMGQLGLFVAQIVLVLVPWWVLIGILLAPIWYWRIRRRPV